MSVDNRENGEDNAAPQPARLSWLAARKLDLWVWCEKCSHHRIVAVAPLLERHGDSSLQELSRCFGMVAAPLGGWFESLVSAFKPAIKSLSSLRDPMHVYAQCLTCAPLL